MKKVEKWSKEVVDTLYECYHKGLPYAESTKLLNELYDNNYTYGSVQAYIGRNRDTFGYRDTEKIGETGKWTKETIDILYRCYHNGWSHAESTTYLNEKFQHNYTQDSVQDYIKRNRNVFGYRGLDRKVIPVSEEKVRVITPYDFSEFKEIEIVALFDMHGLDHHAYVDVFLYKKEYIMEKENRFAILGGDLYNFATKTSKSSCYTTDSPAMEQEFFKEHLKQLAPRILVGIGGNHDKDRGLRGDGIDPMESLFDIAGIGSKYAGNIGIISVSLKDILYNIVVAHGVRGGNARTLGGKLNGCSDMWNIYPNADIYLSGHTHMSAHIPQSTRLIENGNIRNHKYHYIVCGNALGYEGSYAEAMLLKPLPISVAHIKLSTERDRAGQKIVDAIFRP